MLISLLKNHCYLSKLCLLAAIGSLMIITAESYGTMLFLTHYSSKQLTYLYFLVGVSALIYNRLTQTQIQKNYAKFIRQYHVLFSFILSLCFIVKLTLGLSLAIVVPVIMLIVAFVANVIYWNIAMDLITFREYKRYFRFIALAATCGALISGLLIPLTLKLLPSITLLAIFILLLLTANFIVSTLGSLSIAKQKKVKEKTVTLSNQPLYIKGLILFVLMAIIFIATDFNLKHELSLAYNDKEIAAYLAKFFAGVNIIIVLAQFYLVPIVIYRFGVIGLVCIYPGLVFIGGLANLLYPSLITATFLYGCANVGRFAFFMNSIELLINVLPQQVRVLAKFNIFNIGRNFAAIFAAVLLSLLAAVNWFGVIGLLITVVALFMLVIALMTKRDYRRELINSINLHRFNSSYLNFKSSDEAYIEQVITIALQSKAQDVVLFALSLLKKIDFDKVADKILPLLAHPSKIVRSESIKQIQAAGYVAGIDFIIKQLSKEKDPELKWELSQAILQFKPRMFLVSETESLDDDNMLEQACAICASTLVGNESQKQSALMLFQRLFASRDSNKRLWATRILLTTPQVENSNLVIAQQLQDSNPAVVKALIQVAAKRRDDKLTVNILQKLTQAQFRVVISQSLQMNPAHTRKHVLIMLNSSSDTTLIVHLIMLLALLDDGRVEADLLTLCASGDFVKSYIACMHLAYRNTKWPLNAESVAKLKPILISIIEQSTCLIIEKHICKYPTLAVEMDSRLVMMKSNYLYLLAILCNSRLILRLIPSLLGDTQHHSEHSKAIELLEISLNDNQLKPSIALVLEENVDTKSCVVDVLAIDPWLNKVNQYVNKCLRGDAVDIINKVVVLRKLNLFSGLFPEAIEIVAENLESKDVAKKEVIFAENESADGLYILAKGEIEVIKADGSIKTSLEAPAYFGELALLDDEPRFATVTANCDSELYFLDKVTFSRLIDEQPQILKTLVKAVLGYYRHKETAVI